MITKEDLLEKLGNLPTLSVSVSGLLRLMNDPRADAASFERVIMLDPALTANVLKMANSAFFGSPREVKNIRQAVLILGTRRLCDMAVSASFARIIPPILPGYGIDSATFWRHCAAVAIISEKLAAITGHVPPSDAFTPGLLHDLGKLVISAYLAETKDQIMSGIREGKQTMVGLEGRVLGLDHTEIGTMIAIRWNLPDEIILATRWHHRPDGLPDEAARNLVEIVHVADALAHSLGYGADVGELARAVSPEVEKKMKLKVEQLEKIASETAETIHEAGSLFGALQGGQ